MMSIRTALMSLAAGLALVHYVPAALAVEPVNKKQLKVEKLSKLEKSADSTADYQRLARLYRLRAEMLEEKVERHERLTQRYAATPASLLAKRGTAWNTPGRQRQLANAAREQAKQARERAGTYLAMVGKESMIVSE